MSFKRVVWECCESGMEDHVRMKGIKRDGGDEKGSGDVWMYENERRIGCHITTLFTLLSHHSHPLSPTLTHSHPLSHHSHTTLTPLSHHSHTTLTPLLPTRHNCHTTTNNLTLTPWCEWYDEKWEYVSICE